MRKYLDWLYLGSGAVAAMLIAAICVLVTTQVVLNVITKIGGAGVAMTIPSYADFAGYFLAASSFLALAYTLTRGGHIRVTLILKMLGGGKSSFIAEIISLFVCTLCAIFATYYMAGLVLESYQFGDMSSGIIAVPLWLPQTTVLLGLAIFAIALTDVLIRSFREGRSVVKTAEGL